MGLKYDMFMVKGSAKELYNKIDALDWSFDVTKWMFAEREFMEGRAKHFWIECVMVEIDERYLKRPDDLQAYNDRTDKKWYYGIWWMDVPFETKESFCVGGYSRMFTLGRDYYLDFLLTNLSKANVNQYMYMQFHHGSNEGSYMEVCDGYWDDHDNLQHYEMLESEAYKFEKYSRRVQKKSGYPVYEWHKYMQGLRGLVPWEFEMDLDMVGYFALAANTFAKEGDAKENGGKEKTIKCYQDWVDRRNFIIDRMYQSKQSLLCSCP